MWKSAGTHSILWWLCWQVLHMSRLYPWQFKRNYDRRQKGVFLASGLATKMLEKLVNYVSWIRHVAVRSEWRRWTRQQSDDWATTNGQACRSGRTYTTKYQFGENSVHGGITINRVNWGLQLLLTHSLHHPQFHTTVFDSASRKNGRGRSGSVVRPFRLQENTATGESMAEG